MLARAPGPSAFAVSLSLSLSLSAHFTAERQPLSKKTVVPRNDQLRTNLSATPSYSGPTVAAPGPPSHGRSLTAASLHVLVPIDAGNVINRAVEEAAAEQARNGKEDLVARSVERPRQQRARRIEQIATDAVLDCWGLPLTFDGFLQTRIVELTVHAEDLACSIGVEDSGISDDAKQLVCNIGLSAAIRRNGPDRCLAGTVPKRPSFHRRIATPLTP